MEVVQMWDPFDEIARMHEEMDSLFNRMFKGSSNLLGYGNEEKGLTKWNKGFRAPMADVKETEKNVIANIELPGANKDDIDLNVTDDSIEIKVEKKDEKKEEKKGTYTYSSRMSRFYRRIPLPAEVDAENARASYRNGVLKIEVPKRKEIEHKKKRVDID
ncbi:Hsp20 family protein [Candidatus Woesearchaeota archaeon]|nr:Hsp20 family protein [Candidatus Woesearchaeota archaeon]